MPATEPAMYDPDAYEQSEMERLLERSARRIWWVLLTALVSFWTALGVVIWWR